ncbi:MAG TPA: hypothetical protein VF006_09475 [Longimicrobium sp.]
MYLDLNALQVESFDTAEPIAEPVKDTIYAPCPVRETIFYPCTQAHQSTCVGCA